MRVQHLAGLAVIAAAFLAAILLARMRIDTQGSGQAEVAQRDSAPSPPFASP